MSAYIAQQRYQPFLHTSDGVANGPKSGLYALVGRAKPEAAKTLSTVVGDVSITFSTADGRAKLAAAVDQFQTSRNRRGSFTQRLSSRLVLSRGRRQSILTAAATAAKVASRLAVTIDYNLFESAFLVASVRRVAPASTCGRVVSAFRHHRRAFGKNQKRGHVR